MHSTRKTNGGELVGGVEIAGLSEAEFADQAVLAGAPGALDAAFGLGRVGGDADAELVERRDRDGWEPVCRRVVRRGSSGHRCAGRWVTIAIEAERHAVSGDHGVQRAQIAEGVFRFELKMGREDLAGGSS